MAPSIRVGILHDMADSIADDESLGGVRDAIMRLAIDDLVERGRLDREVELVHAAGLGLPAGTVLAEETAGSSRLELLTSRFCTVLGTRDAPPTGRTKHSPVADSRIPPDLEMKGHAVNIDPELAPALPHLPTLSVSDFATARETVRTMTAATRALPLPDGVDVEDRTIDGPEGDPLTLRIFRPSGAATDAPAVLHLHGGGFTLGDLDTEQMQAAALAGELGAVIVSVGYRLAPEHPFPAPMEDCYAGLVWTERNAEELGIDRERIGVYGISAGGALAASVALAARDRNGPALCFQLLATPVLDDRLTTPSMQAFVDTPMWSRPHAEASWAAYLGDGGNGDVSPYAAPARATDLSGLPPAYVSTAEIDPLRDEGVLYALAMLQAGVSVELHQYPGTFHGSTMIPAAVSERQSSDLREALRRGLGG